MRTSIKRKVTWGTSVLLLLVVFAMGTTYFLSTAAIDSIRKSQELNQKLLAFTTAMETDTLAGGINVLRYLATGNPAFRSAYHQQSERFSRYVSDMSGLMESSQWREVRPAFDSLFRKFDQHNLSLLASHDAGQSTTLRDIEIGQLFDLQQEIMSLIATRVRPNLRVQASAAEGRAASSMVWVLCLAGGMSLLFSLLAVIAGRYVRRAIVAPVEHLTASADVVARGDFGHRVSIEADAEFMALARNFNHMVNQLQSTTVSKSLHEEQATQLRALLDGIREYAIFSIDADGKVTSWNAASTSILGYTPDEMVGASIAKMFKNSRQARALLEEGLGAVFSSGCFEEDMPLVTKFGREFEANIVIAPVGLTAAANGYSVVVRDITERVMAERRIEHLATKDALTGLFNRSMLMEQMSFAVSRAARAHMQLAVLFVDLDKFKVVNDTLGHAAGDELLVECARRLRARVRDVDIVARLGGDEFVVVLTDLTDTSTVSTVAGRMLQSLTTPYSLRGHQAVTSASIGICVFPADGRDVATLMKNADIAMYHAKEMGRDNYQFFAEEMNQRLLRRAQLERELRSALENHEFELYYQPQVVVATGKIRGAESLIRWRHPTRGLVSPDEFIPVAEETGLIVPLGEWILDHACRTVKTWHEHGVNMPYVVVNVSAAQLDDELVKAVRRALVTHGIAANWLMLEVTETMLMGQVEQSLTILRRIRELGIRIALDDFGTGYSSLSVLQRMPVDTLKIDRSFVRAIDDQADNSRAVAIIGAIVAIAKELGLTVVAEGVETLTQLAFLRTLNCDTYQGYIYSKPIDTITLEARFAAPVKSVLEDEQGRAITMATNVNLELQAAAST